MLNSHAKNCSVFRHASFSIGQRCNYGSASLLLLALALILLLAPTPSLAFDQPWNGFREDITGPEDDPPDDDCPSGNCDPDLCPGTNAGSPVYVAKGFLSWSDTDIVFSAPANVSLTRTYNSFDRRAGLFGRGWMTMQEVNIAQTFKALTEGSEDGSPKLATEYQSVPIWMAETGRRYTLEETADSCVPPSVLYFHFEKLADGRYRKVYDSNPSYDIFSATGVLLESYDEKAGTTTYFEYNDRNQLVRQTDSYGFSLAFAYNDRGFVSTVTDQADRQWQYRYNDDGNLIEVEDPDEDRRNYSYQTVDKVGYKLYLLTAVDDNQTDPVLRVDWSESRLHGSAGFRVASFIQYGGEYNGLEQRYEYSATTTSAEATATRVRKSLHQPGFSTPFERITFVIELDTYRITQKTSIERGQRFVSIYDDRGNLTERTDERGNLTRYEYNDIGQITSMEEFADTDNARVTTYTYVEGTDRIAVQNEFGLLETRYSYDEHLRLTGETRVDVLTGVTRTWTHSYYPNSTDSAGNTVLGRLAASDGPKPGGGDSMQFQYNDAGQVTQIAQPHGQVLQYSYNAAGQLATALDANNVPTNTVYDSESRPTEIDRNGRVTRYQYDAQGLVTQSVDELDRATTYAYNDRNDLARIDFPSGDYLLVSYDYQATYTDRTDGYFRSDGEKLSDNTLRVDLLTSFAAASYLENTSEQATASDYNDFDDLTQLTRFGQFAGRNRSITQYVYDHEGRPSEEIAADGGQTSYSYNSLSQLTALTDPVGGVTSYLQNALGDLVTLVNPHTGTMEYSYNIAGELTQSVDSESRQFDYSNDLLGRVTAIDYAGDDLDVTFNYDEGTFGQGRLTSVTDGSGSTVLQYDDRGNPILIDRQIAGISLPTAFQWDASNAVIKISYPSGLTISYDYDASDRIVNIRRSAATGEVSVLSADSWYKNRLKSYTLGNGMPVVLQFDAAGRNIGKTFGGEVNAFENTLDNAGNVIRQMWTIGDAAQTTEYRYDDKERLTHDSAYGLVVTYDTYDNRKTKTTPATGIIHYGYESESSRLVSIGDVQVELDASGNTVKDERGNYAYNAFNRLATFTSADARVRANYQYNFVGQRVRKLLSGERAETATDIRFVYGLAGELLGEYDSTGNRIREYVYAYEGNQPEPLAQIESDGRILYLHSDHLLTPRLSSDSSRAVVWTWLSDAFGESLPDRDSNSDNLKETILLRFPGQYFDEESGLHYNYIRSYDPRIGRYTSADRLDALYLSNEPSLTIASDTGLTSLPMGGVGSFDFEGVTYNYAAIAVSTVGLNHPYGYARQNPVNDIDDSGLNPARVAIAVALAAAKAAKKQILKASKFCKTIRCKIENHDAHHRFGWPYNERRKHIQLTCWRKGVKGSTFIIRFPY